jgi:hypothetical protein
MDQSSERASRGTEIGGPEPSTLAYQIYQERMGFTVLGRRNHAPRRVPA